MIKNLWWDHFSDVLLQSVGFKSSKKNKSSLAGTDILIRNWHESSLRILLQSGQLADDDDDDDDSAADDDDDDYDDYDDADGDDEFSKNIALVWSVG